MMNVLLIGAGAVGTYFCGRLAQGGAKVAVVARGDYEVVKGRGYHIRSVAGDFDFHPAAVLKDSADYQETPDYVIAATKVLPELDLVGMLRPVIRSPKTVIVLIQNGIDIEKTVRAAFPDNELLSTIAYIGVSRPARGEVLHQGSGNLKTGVYPSGISESAKRLAAAFGAGGVKCELSEDIRFVRWYKLLWNLPFNPVSVLAGRVDTRTMTDRAELEKLCWSLMLETIAVANACGVALSEKDARSQMEYTREVPAYKTSMLQDFEAGRELEVEAILGNAVRLAHQNNVPVPKMEACYALLKSVNLHRS